VSRNRKCVPDEQDILQVLLVHFHSILQGRFRHYASSGVSRVQQLEEVDAAISDTDTDDMFFVGIDPRVMSIFDLQVPIMVSSITWSRSSLLLLLVLHIVSPISCAVW
jgi:hypothetical protein